jgi:hypothetical protein
MRQVREKQRHDGHGMRPMAEESVQYHTRPAPGTAEPIPRPFPALLWYGIGGGLVIGAALGLLFGWLLFSGALAPRGWEGIFSLGPFTFHVFWTVMGAALGLLLGGVATLLVAEPEPYEPED